MPNWQRESLEEVYLTAAQSGKMEDMVTTLPNTTLQARPWMDGTALGNTTLGGVQVIFFCFFLLKITRVENEEMIRNLILLLHIYFKVSWKFIILVHRHLLSIGTFCPWKLKQKKRTFKMLICLFVCLQQDYLAIFIFFNLARGNSPPPLAEVNWRKLISPRELCICV